VSSFRVLRALPTLLHLAKAGARVIVVTHIGRKSETTLAPLHRVLKEHIEIEYEPSLVGREALRAVEALKDGQVLLLENLRSHDGETKNDASFAKQLSAYADIYVNDAFAVSHREHASIVGIPRYIPGYIGITFNEEYAELSKAMKPKHPALFILGGAKFETKQPLVKKYLDTYDHVFIGGALANDFFKGRGYEVGESLVSGMDLSGSELLKSEKILLPVDVVVEEGKQKHVVSVERVTKGQNILDAGPKTVEILGDHIKGAKTILWNGPLGYYEGGYTASTKDCAALIAKSGAYSVVGGGDTVAAIESLSIDNKFNFLSTAGGAMLTFLEHGTLPGIEAIKANKHD
jgi:phosphoglycerate kinase